MKKNDQPIILFCNDFLSINSPDFKDCGVHLLCLEGKGSFRYGGRKFEIGKDDAVILSRLDLVNDLDRSDDLRVVYVVASFGFIYRLLPANHYGIGGGISLFDDPVIPLSADDATRFYDDLRKIGTRAGDKTHLFYEEIMGSLILTMVYDLFDFHAKIHASSQSTERRSGLVRRLVSLLEGGRSKHHRQVAYYASLLSVTPKYLSDTVRRTTGRSVMSLIDRHTVSLITDCLRNSDLSLTQIADEFGFSSLSHFSRYVKRQIGMTPTKYRSTLIPR